MSFLVPPVNIQMSGTVAPAADLHDSARRSLTADEYQLLLIRHGEQFTAKQLVSFVEDSHGS